MTCTQRVLGSSLSPSKKSYIYILYFILSFFNLTNLQHPLSYLLSPLSPLPSFFHHGNGIKRSFHNSSPLVKMEPLARSLSVPYTPLDIKRQDLLASATNSTNPLSMMDSAWSPRTGLSSPVESSSELRYCFMNG